MKQIFDERHIGCPVLAKTFKKSKKHDKRLFFDLILLGLYYDIELDTAFIFRMLDAAGYDWVQWIAMDDCNTWQCFEHKPNLETFGFAEWRGEDTNYGMEFSYWPYPGSWKDSLIKRGES